MQRASQRSGLQRTAYHTRHARRRTASQSGLAEGTGKKFPVAGFQLLKKRVDLTPSGSPLIPCHPYKWISLKTCGRLPNNESIKDTESLDSNMHRARRPDSNNFQKTAHVTDACDNLVEILEVETA